MVRVLYWRLEGWRLDAIAPLFGVTRERIRQIEAEARMRIQTERPTGEALRFERTGP